MDSLKDINVLVDGYNLGLSQGTGIKTYGISLIQALKLLEADLNILFDFKFKNYSEREQVIAEALFFDPRWREEENVLNKLSALKVLIGKALKAKELKFQEIVIKDKKRNADNNILQDTGVFNANSCYQIANFLFKKLQIETKINLKKKIEIFHATYPLPLQIKGTKKITTIHDLIPLRLPYTTLDDKEFFYRLIKKSIRNSDLIITVSESSKKDIVDIYKCSPEKICVTYQPLTIDSTNLEKDLDKISTSLNRYKLVNEKYILFVGAIEPKKNVGRLIDAYAALRPDLRLVIVGKKGWLWENEIGKLEALFGKNFPRKVLLLDYVSAQDLKYLYQGAYCFVFPSLYEGFGLPPLEAMSLGCPVITSNTSSLPEVCGDAALYVDPYDVKDIADKLEQIISDRQLRDKLAQLGRERAKLFTMDKYLSRIFDAYNKVLK